MTQTEIIDLLTRAGTQVCHFDGRRFMLAPGNQPYELIRTELHDSAGSSLGMGWEAHPVQFREATAEDLTKWRGEARLETPITESHIDSARRRYGLGIIPSQARQLEQSEAGSPSPE